MPVAVTQPQFDPSARPAPPPSAPAPTGRGQWFAPFLAPVLRQRKLVVALGAAGVYQLAAAVFHFPGVVCPMLHGLGIPCPGCGASRACGALVRGEWHTALRLHAMAPFFLLAVVLFAAAAVLPARGRDRVISWVETVERWTGLTQVLLAILFIYWLARLLYAPHAFIRLVGG